MGIGLRVALGRVGSGRVQELRKISGSGRITLFAGRVAKFGPACNCAMTLLYRFRDVKRQIMACS